MSASFWGGEIRRTKRYQLGQLLSTLTRHFLLLTAMPHNGAAKITYIREPFGREPDFGVTSINYKLAELLAKGSIPC